MKHLGSGKLFDLQTEEDILCNSCFQRLSDGILNAIALAILNTLHKQKWNFCIFKSLFFALLSLRHSFD